MKYTPYFVLYLYEGGIRIALSNNVKSAIGMIDSFDPMPPDQNCAREKYITVSGELGSFSQRLPISGTISRTNLRSNGTWVVDIIPDPEGLIMYNELPDEPHFFSVRLESKK